MPKQKKKWEEMKKIYKELEKELGRMPTKKEWRLKYLEKNPSDKSFFRYFKIYFESGIIKTIFNKQTGLQEICLIESSLRADKTEIVSLITEIKTGDKNIQKWAAQKFNELCSKKLVIYHDWIPKFFEDVLDTNRYADIQLELLEAFGNVIKISIQSDYYSKAKELYEKHKEIVVGYVTGELYQKLHGPLSRRSEGSVMMMRSSLKIMSFFPNDELLKMIYEIIKDVHFSEELEDIIKHILVTHFISERSKIIEELYSIRNKTIYISNRERITELISEMGKY